jgi:predicted CXXCH cytochrome family protein
MKIRLKRSLAGFLLCSMLSGLSLVSMNLVFADASEVLPGSRAAGLESCVIPDTEDMRRNHMEYLYHRRDQTVHQGIRTHGDDVISMRGCVACHAAKNDQDQYVPVNDEGQFCQTCHQRVAVELDCFDCHRTTPETN